MPTDRTRLQESNYGWHNRPTMAPFNGPVSRHESPHRDIQPGQRVTIPQFEIASSPTFNLAEIRSRRFSFVDRDPLPVAVTQLLDHLMRTKRVPEPIPEPHGPIWRRSRYEVLAAA